MRVRAATPEDAKVISEVRVRSWQEAYAHVFPAEALARLDAGELAVYWRERIAAGDTLLVTDDLTGFAAIGPSPDPAGAGEVYAIYVDPDRWGTGCGRALMEASLANLRAAGFDEVVLWVLEDNPRARRFYEAGGWTLDGAEKDEDWLETPVREVRYRISLR
jgi:GNAT superfamily N-acetyltransferase